MREMLSITAAIMGQGLGEHVRLVTDGRFSGGDGPVRRPRRAGGLGRGAHRIRQGRRPITIDVADRTLSVEMDDVDSAEHRWDRCWLCLHPQHPREVRQARPSDNHGTVCG